MDEYEHELSLKIARAKGWVIFDEPNLFGKVIAQTPEGDVCEIPDYCHDLNAALGLLDGLDYRIDHHEALNRRRIYWVYIKYVGDGDGVGARADTFEGLPEAICEAWLAYVAAKEAE